MVRVRSRDTFPADLLLLRASDPPGQCWVNTKPLDGETDSKLRVVPKQLLPLLEKQGACEAPALRKLLRGARVRCEVPNDKVRAPPEAGGLQRRSASDQLTGLCG